MKPTAKAHLSMAVTLLAIASIIKENWAFILTLIVCAFFSISFLFILSGKPKIISSTLSKIELDNIFLFLAVLAVGLVLLEKINLWLGFVVVIVAYIIIIWNVIVQAKKARNIITRIK